MTWSNDGPRADLELWADLLEVDAAASWLQSRVADDPGGVPALIGVVVRALVELRADVLGAVGQIPHES